MRLFLSPHRTRINMIETIRLCILYSTKKGPLLEQQLDFAAGDMSDDKDNKQRESMTDRAPRVSPSTPEASHDMTTRMRDHPSIKATEKTRLTHPLRILVPPTQGLQFATAIMPVPHQDTLRTYLNEWLQRGLARVSTTNDHDTLGPPRPPLESIPYHRFSPVRLSSARPFARADT